MPPVILIDPGGVPRDVPEEAVPAALERGWRAQTAADVQSAAAAQANQADYGGVTGALKATAAAGARGVTLGLSDVALRALGGEEAATDLRGLREENPGLSAGGEIAGALAPVLLSGGSAAPAAVANRAGARVASELGGGILARGVGGAVEGGIGAIGATASDLALSSDPITVEGVASSLSSNLLYGAGVGGAVGLGTAAVERGLLRAKGALDARLAKGRAPAPAAEPPVNVDGTPGPAPSSEPPPLTPRAALDLDNMTTAELKAAREAEIEAIHADRAPLRKEFVADLKEHLRATDQERYWDYAKGHPDRYTRELRRSSVRADKTIRRLLDDEVGLAERPHVVRTALREQTQALDRMHTAALKEEQAIRAAFEDAPAQIRGDIIAGKVPGWVPDALSKRGLDIAVEREVMSRFGVGAGSDPALAVPERVRKAIEDIPKIKARNALLQDAVEAIAAEPRSARLAQIKSAIDHLSAPQEKSIGAAVLGAIPFAGRLAEVVSAGQRVTGGVRAAGARAARRVGEAASRFLGVAAAGAEAIGPRVPTATAALSRVRYAPPRKQRDDQRTPTSGPLEAAFRDRTDEIKRQVSIDPTGMPRMRPDARARMATTFDGLRVHDPIMADRLEGAAARRLEFLARVMPRPPDFGTPRSGPDHRKVTELQMRSFARSVYAAEHPEEVLELAAQGRVVPEHVEALRAVAPEMLADFVARVSSEMASTPRRLPWKRRLALSILSGQPLDPLMTPALLAPIQAMYATEPGTEGGMQAPRAEPQFGSVRAAPPTASQKREQDR